VDKYPLDWKPPHDWPVNLAIELATIYDIYSLNGPQVRPFGSVQLPCMENPATL